MKNKFLLLFTLFAACTFSACNKGGKTGLLVPKDAGLVLHIDLSSLSSKLSWEEIQQTAWFAEASKKADDSLAKKLLADPAASGVDTDGSLVIFMTRTGNSGYVAVEGKLKDVEKFKNSILEGNRGKASITKDGDLNFAKIEDSDDATLYFNDKIFVFIADASDTKKVAGNQSFPQPGESKKYTLDSLKYFAKNTFSLKGKYLLDSDERFADMISDKADAHYWVNAGGLYGGLLSGPLAMMKIGDVLQGNISTGKANFENGKIVFDGKTFYNEKLADLFKKYAGKEVSNELLGKLPDQNVLAAFAMNYNPDGIKEFLKLLGVDGMANAAMAQFGYSVDEFIKANAGDLAFALTDFSIHKKPTTLTLENGEVIKYDDEKPDMKFVFGISVNDKAAFQKLVDLVGRNLKDKMPGTDSSTNHLKNKLQDKWFAFGTSDAEVDAFLNGNKKPAYADIFKGHNGGGFVDLQKFIIQAAASNKDTASKKAFDISAAFWKNINAFWDVKSGNATTHFEINLQDGSSNSLKQLNKYFDQMYLSVPKNKEDDLGFVLPGDTTGTTPDAAAH